MKKQIIYMLCATALLSSCHIYKAYDRPDEINASASSGLYRDPVAENDTLVGDTTNFGNRPWREVFTDPQLQALIETGLERNADLLSAVEQVKAAQASLLSSKLAFIPSLTLSPQGTISSFDNSKASKTYTIPVNASWQISLFGGLMNSKRGAEANTELAKANKQAVQTQVIANIASLYYTLLMLDRQKEITQNTAKILKRNYEAMEMMMEGAINNIDGSGVEQSKAAYAQVEASIPDIEQSIRETEGSLSMLLRQAPQHIERGRLEDQQMPDDLSAGVPMQLLSNRPDVKAAEMSLAYAYYNTNIARANFYPNITLTGTAGWTNSAGSQIINPGKFIASAVGSLVQPLFQNGANIAQLKVSKAQEEQARLGFEQALLNAGNEVSNALSLYQTTNEKAEARQMQVESSKLAAERVRDLYELYNYSFLEVLSAEQSYLSAQLSEVEDYYNCLQAVINLYQALGGGRDN